MPIKFILFSMLLFLSACGSEDCFDIASDQLRFADSIVYDGKEYHLYTRTSGWQEKIVYFELYESKPTYNNCTYETKPEPIFGIHYDYFSNDLDSNEKYVKEIILQPDQPEKLKITYTKNIDEGVANVYDVKFTR